MSRLLVPVVLTVAYLSGIAYCDPKWLMLGTYYPEGRMSQPFVDLDTQQSYMSVSTRMQVTVEARQDKLITCVIAAAVHLKGSVSVVDGGLNSKSVTLRYVTDSGEPDVFYVLVQSSGIGPTTIQDNVASNSKYAVVVDSLRNWETDGEEA